MIQGSQIYMSVCVCLFFERRVFAHTPEAYQIKIDL